VNAVVVRSLSTSQGASGQGEIGSATATNGDGANDYSSGFGYDGSHPGTIPAATV
jgi:hypothetical protein